MIYKNLCNSKFFVLGFFLAKSSLVLFFLLLKTKKDPDFEFSILSISLVAFSKFLSDSPVNDQD